MIEILLLFALASFNDNQIIWAGFSGIPPRYFDDSHPSQGYGYIEYETLEIRKTLENAGFKIKHYYMSAARLEYEFAKKTKPICFYDYQFSRPNDFFKTPKKPIFSIPLKLSGNIPQKIIIRKNEKKRFAKHLDNMGNINIHSLLLDKNLKTELILGKKYGDINKIILENKLELDGSLTDVVKGNYSDNINLFIQSTNDQILQMLERKRIDYQFLDHIEFEDYKWTKGIENFETLIYHTQSIKNLNDPGIIYHTVACVEHPNTIKALPIINNTINEYRTMQNWINKNKFYKTQLDSLNQDPTGQQALTSLNKAEINQADSWYYSQFNNKRIPMFSQGESDYKANLRLKKRDRPQWLWINFNEHYIIINEIDLYDLPTHVAKFNYHFSEINEIKNNLSKYTIDRNSNFQNLNLNTTKKTQVEKLTIFNSGIDLNNFRILFPFIFHEKLKEISLVETNAEINKTIITNLPKTLEKISIVKGNLLGLDLKNAISKFSKLKEINFNGSNISLTQSKELLKILPTDIESIKFNAPLGESFSLLSWDREIAQIFSNKKWTKLKHLSLRDLNLNDSHFSLILKNLPLCLQTLDIGRSLGNVLITISDRLLSEFLRKQYNHLTTLDLSNVRIYVNLLGKYKIIFPSSLKELSLSFMHINEELIEKVFILSAGTKLKKIEILNRETNNRQSIISDKFLENLISFFDNNMDELSLSSTRCKGTFFRSFKNKQFIKKLSFNDVRFDFEGIQSLINSPIQVNEFHASLSNLSDKDIELIALKFKGNLRKINLSNNIISKIGIRKLLIHSSKNLNSLILDNILSINIKDLIDFMPQKLEKLSLDGILLSDLDIKKLAPKLPKDLRFLNIGGALMTSLGAFELAQHMPNLINLTHNLNHKYQNGHRYLLQNSSHFLTNLTINSPSKEITQSYLQNLPPYIKRLELSDILENECEIYLNNLSKSITKLQINNMIFNSNCTKKLNSQNLNSLQELKLINAKFNNNNLDTIPTFLLASNWTDYTQISTKDFLRVSEFSLSLKSLNIRKNDLSIIKLFPGYTSFYLCKIEPGSLNLIGREQLKNLVHISFSFSYIEPKELIAFIKKLPPGLERISLVNSQISAEMIDDLINALPSNLRFLQVSNNPLGEVGLKKLREYKNKKEALMQYPFYLGE